MNMTNGVTPRRFIALCQPASCRPHPDTIGGDWLRIWSGCGELEPYADDSAFLDRWRRSSAGNKQRLAEHHPALLRRSHSIPIRSSTFR